MTKTTIIIPTYNRLEKLKQTLDALCNQTFKEFEVIIIDDGSKNDTFSKISQISTLYPYNISCYTQQNSGASKALNNGISKVNSGLIILLDDDIIPSEDCIKMHVEHHQKYKNTLLSGSANTSPSSAITDVEKYKLFMESVWKKKNINKLKVTFENYVITTANMSLSKEVFDKIGGFDESLRDGYDFEFGLRALRKNIDSYFDLNIETIHNDHMTLRYFAKRQKCYIESKKIIFSKNPEYQELLRKQTPIKVPFFKLLFYKLLRINFIVNFIEESKVMVIIPRKIRFKIYGVTIAALSM